MHPVWRQLTILGVAVLPGYAAMHAQQANQIVAQAVQAELAADGSDHSRWVYFEVDKKPGNTVQQWVAETNEGDLKRVVKRDGRPLSTSEQQSGIDSYAEDPAAQAKQHKGDRHDDRQARQMLSMLPKAFLWTKLTDRNGRTVLHFAPNPQFNPPTYEARVFAAMEGKMTVDDRQHRIVSLEGRMIRDVKFGYGLFGELRAGGSFDVERRETGDGVWQITETHVHIAGRALLFKSISDQEDDVKSHFKQISPNIALASAEKLLMAQNSDGAPSSQEEAENARHQRAADAGQARIH